MEKLRLDTGDMVLIRAEALAILAERMLAAYNALEAALVQNMMDRMYWCCWLSCFPACQREGKRHCGDKIAPPPCGKGHHMRLLQAPYGIEPFISTMTSHLRSQSIARDDETVTALHILLDHVLFETALE
jgi:hypothetical protein